MSLKLGAIDVLSVAPFKFQFSSLFLSIHLLFI